MTDLSQSDAADVIAAGAEPRSDGAGLSKAITAASQPPPDGAGDVNAKARDAVQKALNDTSLPVFNTFTHAIDALFAAQELTIKAQVADIDAKIAALNAERTNAMLAFSMLSAGRMAKEKGASG